MSNLEQTAALYEEPSATAATPNGGCALTDIAWIRTIAGPMTVREALVNAHTITGLDPSLNGIEAGTHYRFLTAVAALIWRHGSSGRTFDPTAVDTVLDSLSHHTNVFSESQPFLQTPAPPGVLAVAGTTAVKRLYPWMPADRAESFWTANPSPKVLNLPEAVLALSIHYHYSFGGNNKIHGRACTNGSPGIRYPGVGYTATELLWHGATLHDTLRMNTPKAWVEGTGLPAWADPTCIRSQGAAGQPEHPLWRATWGSNTAQVLWDGPNLIAVSIGGSRHRPPTMGTDKAAAKAWWDQRNTDDTFYLYADVQTKNAAGIVTSVQRKAQRLDLGHHETDLAVEWNSKGLSAAVRSRSKGAVKTPGRDDKIMFLRHLVEGTATCPVVRRTEVLVTSPKKWAVDEYRADAVSDAATIVKAVCSEVTKPFTLKGRLTALRDRRTDVETAFWLKVSAPFDDFIINGTGESVDPRVWPLVHAAALSAFDEVVASAPGPKLAPFIMTARNRVSLNTAQALGLIGQKAGPE